MNQPSADAPDLDAPLILVTADSHIGPRLNYDLRPYCPEQYLDEYDDFIRAYEPYTDPATVRKMFVPEGADVPVSDVEPGGTFMPANNTLGHFDVNVRLHDMDRDGVAAEVIYHGSQNAQCFPFLNPENLFRGFPDSERIHRIVSGAWSSN